MSALIDYIFAMREIARVQRNKRVKDAMYRTLVQSDLNYGIIREIAQSIQPDGVIEVTLKDGARLTFRRKPEKVERPPDPGEDLFV